MHDKESNITNHKIMSYFNYDVFGSVKDTRTFVALYQCLNNSSNK